MTKIERNTRIEGNKINFKKAVGKVAETVFTSLFCSAVLVYPGKSKVDSPEILHEADDYTDPTPLGDMVYFPPGMTARTSIDGFRARISDFPKGRDHNGRGVIVFDDKHIILHPGVPVSLGPNGAKAMHIKKRPHEITPADIAVLKGEAK